MGPLSWWEDEHFPAIFISTHSEHGTCKPVEELGYWTLFEGECYVVEAVLMLGFNTWTIMYVAFAFLLFIQHSLSVRAAFLTRFADFMHTHFWRPLLSFLLLLLWFQESWSSCHAGCWGHDALQYSRREERHDVRLLHLQALYLDGLSANHDDVKWHAWTWYELLRSKLSVLSCSLFTKSFRFQPFPLNSSLCLELLPMLGGNSCFVQWFASLEVFTTCWITDIMVLAYQHALLDLCNIM